MCITYFSFSGTGSSHDKIATMVNQLFKGFVDSIYGTGRVRRRFELDNPNEKVLASDASKGIVTTTNQNIQRGLDWVISQRAEPIDNPASLIKYSIPPTII